MRYRMLAVPKGQRNDQWYDGACTVAISATAYGSICLLIDPLRNGTALFRASRSNGIRK